MLPRPHGTSKFKTNVKLKSLVHVRQHLTRFRRGHDAPKTEEFMLYPYWSSKLEWATPWFSLAHHSQRSSVLNQTCVELQLPGKAVFPPEAASVPAAHTRGRIRQSCALKHTHALPTCAFHSRNTLFLNHFYASLGTNSIRGSVPKEVSV